MGGWEVIALATFAAIAVMVLAFRTGIWISEVNSDRRQFREFMGTMRDEFREFRVGMRDEFREFRVGMRDEFRAFRRDMCGEPHDSLEEIHRDIREDRKVSRKIGRDVEDIKVLLDRLPSAAISNSGPLHVKASSAISCLTP